MLNLKSIFETAKELSGDSTQICRATERILANHGIRVGITEVVICHGEKPYARGHIVDICFSDIWGFYAVFIGTLFIGGSANCFIPEAGSISIYRSN